MTRFLLVCAGGAAGTAARYAIALWAGAAFPIGTLIVNVTGSFLIAFIMQIAATTPWMPADVRVMLTTGVMGGFTTYSAFNYETTEYFRGGAWLTALTNIAATLIGCLAAGMAGIALARVIAGR